MYSVHDPESGIIEWAPHTYSTKSDVVKGPAPTDQMLQWRIFGGRPFAVTLIHYAFNMFLCVMMTLAWKQWLYPELTSQYTNDRVKLYSALYFLGSMFVVYSTMNLVQDSRYKTVGPGHGKVVQGSMQSKLLSDESIALLGLALVGLVARKAYAKNAK